MEACRPRHSPGPDRRPPKNRGARRPAAARLPLRREAMMIPLFLQFILAAFDIDPSIADVLVRTLSFLWRIIG